MSADCPPTPDRGATTEVLFTPMTPMRLDVVEDVLATPVRPVLRVVMLHVSRHEDEYLTVSDRADQIWVSLRTAQLALRELKDRGLVYTQPDGSLRLHRGRLRASARSD